MKRILIFEQDTKEALHLSQFLQNAGYAVAPVTTGRQAACFIREYEVDLFLVNLGTPGENGYTTIAELKCRRPAPFVVAIVPNLELRNAAEAAGCDHVIVSPFDNEELLRAITDLLESSCSSTTYTSEPMETADQPGSPVSEEAKTSEKPSFASIMESIEAGIASLDGLVSELGDQGPLALQSMADASRSLRTRLKPEQLVPGQKIPVSVQDRKQRHDFRNMLAAVNGFSEILLLESKLGDECRSLLEGIKRDSRKFCGLLDSIKESAA